LSRLYLGRFSNVHIGGPSSNQATSLESQMIHPIQLLPGRTLRKPQKPHSETSGHSLLAALASSIAHPFELEKFFFIVWGTPLHMVLIS
ncbi:MAG: hypothetical protein ACLPIG_14020, partial [Methylocella sp.]